MAFGVYVHIPYCVKKCPYCDFNSYGVGESFPERDYTESVLQELELYAEVLDGTPLSTIFFGGGTPSLFEARNIEKIISKIIESSSPSAGLEVSLEINPNTADFEKLYELRQAGVNRVSFGVQSFSERKLRFLGRINSPDDGRCILEDVKRAGFENFNIDLMYGTTDETQNEWENDLEEAISFNSTHISAYCLMIEDGTQFGNLYRRGKLTLPEDEELSEFITFTTEYLEESGYRQYEISNYSKRGFECRHNMLYWRGDSYLGVGAGAHSHLRGAGKGWGIRRGNIKNPGLYMKSVRASEMPVDFSEELQKHEALEDTVLMGLRLSSGLEFKSLRESYNVTADEYKIGYLVKGGLIEITGGSVRLTEKGNLLSNAVIERFLDTLDELD
jgi:putative oxygen-independent coproporphyrinogen III oxidase